jgi:hypothetical protein
MSFVLRALLDDIAAAGGLKGRAHREALDVVDAYARGEAPTPETIEAVRTGVVKVVGRIGVGSPPLTMALSYVPIELLLRMVESGDDLSRYVLEHAALSVVGDRPGGPSARLEALRAQAAAVAEQMQIDGALIPAPAYEVAASGSVRDLDLPAIAIAHLAARGAARGGKHAPADATSALLSTRGYEARPEVLAFEEAYGGLELVESDPDAPALVVGPYAFLSALPRYSGRRADLVTVVVASNDVYYALDAKGCGHTKAAMVEGVFRPSAPNGRVLLTQAILWRALETHPGSFATREGLHGAAMAKERGLGPIGEASGETERWWGDADGMQLVVEIDRGNGFEGPVTYATFAGP